MNEEKEQNTIKYLKKEVELNPERKTGHISVSATDIREGPPVQQKRLVVRGVSTTTFQTFKNAKIDFTNNASVPSGDVKPVNEGNTSRYVDEQSIPSKHNISNKLNTEFSSEDSNYILDSVSCAGDNLQESNINETSLRNNQRMPNFSEYAQSGYYNNISSNKIDINKEPKSQKFYQDKLEDHIGFYSSTATQVLNHQEDSSVPRLSSINGEAKEEVLDQKTSELRKDQQIIANKSNTSGQNTENNTKISLSSLFTTHLNDKNSDVKFEPIRVVERVIVKNVEKEEKEKNVVIRIIKSFLFSILQFIGCLLFLVLSILFVLIIYLNFL